MMYLFKFNSPAVIDVESIRVIQIPLDDFVFIYG